MARIRLTIELEGNEYINTTEANALQMKNWMEHGTYNTDYKVQTMINSLSYCNEAFFGHKVVSIKCERVR